MNRMTAPSSPTVVVASALAAYAELDEYTADYIAQLLLQQENDEDEDGEKSEEIIRGLVETLVDEADVDDCVEALLACRDGLRESLDANEEVVEHAAGVDKENHDRSDGTSASSSSSTPSSTPSTSSSAFASTTDEDPSMTMLQAMFPRLSRAFLQRAFVTNGADLEATVDDLLSRDESALLAEMARMRVADEDEDARRRRRRAAEMEGGLDASTKAAIKQSFLLEEVPGGLVGKKKPSKKALRKNDAYLNAQVAGKERESGVRFRDGVVATSKGERYIVENLKEEWNGGSQGKVYTKGKRGKGFVG